MFDKIYTTDELVKILREEQMACVKGQRTFPMPDNAEEIAKQTPLGSILGAQRLFEVGCYHEFRDQVQEYQLANNISGLEIKVCIIGDKLYRFPEPIHQLELTKDDYQVLKLAKDAVVEAFLSRIDEYTYLSFSHEDKANVEFNIETTIGYIRHFAEFCEWAEIIKANDFETTINLGYGDYHQSVYVASHSVAAKYSDSIYFSASKTCDING
jgi:hypothetical protein